MKKIIVCFVSLFMLFGCAKESGYVGRYGLVERDGYAYLVASWEYPDEKNYDISTHEIDTSNFGKYIDESIKHEGSGIPINYLAGVFGYTKSFMKIEPLKMNVADFSKAKYKKITLTIQDDEGSIYEVTLKYDASIKVEE